MVYEFNGDNVEVTGQTFKAMAIDRGRFIVDDMKFNIDVTSDLVRLTNFIEKWKNMEVKIIMV